MDPLRQFREEQGILNAATPEEVADAIRGMAQEWIRGEALGAREHPLSLGVLLGLAQGCRVSEVLESLRTIHSRNQLFDELRKERGHMEARMVAYLGVTVQQQQQAFREGPPPPPPPEPTPNRDPPLPGFDSHRGRAWRGRLLPPARPPGARQRGAGTPTTLPPRRRPGGPREGRPTPSTTGRGLTPTSCRTAGCARGADRPPRPGTAALRALVPAVLLRPR